MQSKTRQAVFSRGSRCGRAPPWPKCSKHNGVSRKLLEPPWPSCDFWLGCGVCSTLRILGMSFVVSKKNTCFLRPPEPGCHERRARGVSIGAEGHFFVWANSSCKPRNSYHPSDRYIYTHMNVFFNGKSVGK